MVSAAQHQIIKPEWLVLRTHWDILQRPTVPDIGQFYAHFFRNPDQKWLLPSIYCDTSPRKWSAIPSACPHSRTQIVETKVTVVEDTWNTWLALWRFGGFSEWVRPNIDRKPKNRSVRKSFSHHHHHHHIHCHPCWIDLTPPCARSRDFLPIM